MNVKKDETREMKMHEKKFINIIRLKPPKLFSVKAVEVSSPSKTVWCKGRYDEAREM
jgi:formylmethanofuran dehydrogenase subunit E